MGKRTPATTRSTYIRATEPGGTKMPASEHRYSSADQGMYGITMPGDTRQSSNYAVQGTSLMQWEDYEGGIWHDTGRTLGPQDYEPAAVVEEEEDEPVVTTTTTEDDDDDDHQVHQSQSWDSYATTEETQAMSEAETARVTRKKLLEEIEARRKLRLKKPRKYGRFSLISNLETGLPSLLSG